MAALPRSIVVRMCMAGCEMPSYLLFEAEDLDAASWWPRRSDWDGRSPG